MLAEKRMRNVGLLSRTVYRTVVLAALGMAAIGAGAGATGCGTGIYQDFTDAINGCCCDDCDDCDDCGDWYYDDCYYGDCGSWNFDFGFGFFDGW